MPAPVYRPTADQVAGHVPHLTRDNSGGPPAGVFSEHTGPTLTQANETIDAFLLEFELDVGRSIPLAHVDTAKRVAALGAAAAIESERNPDRTDDETSAYKALRGRYERSVGGLKLRLEQDVKDTGSGGFGSLPMTSSVAVAPAAQADLSVLPLP